MEDNFDSLKELRKIEKMKTLESTFEIIENGETMDFVPVPALQIDEKNNRIRVGDNENNFIKYEDIEKVRDWLNFWFPEVKG